MPDEKPRGGPTASPGFHLMHAALRWKAAAQSALEDTGLTATQFFVLGAVGWLTKTKGPPTQREAADLAATDAMTLSQVVRALEGRGLVERLPDAADARVFRLRLTSEGEKAVKAASALVRSVDAAFFRDVGDDVTRALRHLSQPE